MKIMRLESWSGGCALGAAQATMVHGAIALPRPPFDGRATTGDFRMTWQTPTATDLRFGFEITMYVSAR